MSDKYANERSALEGSAPETAAQRALGQTEVHTELASGLYVAATPIGNLGDVSARLIETMKAADAILCEDTRHTAKLCNAYGITTPRRPYHEHNAMSVRPSILDALKDGARYCLVSDAGTPLIADPGYKLVAEARAADISIFAIPGPSAVIAALSISGLPTDQFLFAGFPPSKVAARGRFFENLSSIRATLAFYESPNRLASSLGAMANVFRGRRAAVVREITKRHETVFEGPIEDVAATYAKEKTKGEIVVLIAPSDRDAFSQTEEASPASVDRFLVKALKHLSVRDATALALEAFDLSKKVIYARAVELSATE
ncbi:MAG: 16S rRNA (cytidine(1402)-2'-O)-methyltransferase [Pseudomonadota bacterium]